MDLLFEVIKSYDRTINYTIGWFLVLFSWLMLCLFVSVSPTGISISILTILTMSYFAIAVINFVEKLAFIEEWMLESKYYDHTPSLTRR